MNMKHEWHAALAAAGLALGASVAHAGTPQLLSEREMSDVYGQGLSAPAIDALSGAGNDRNNTSLDALSSTSNPLVSLASLSGDASRGFDRRLSEQEALAATNGLQNTINLSRLVVDASKFRAPVPALVLPSLSLGFLFGFLPSLPSIPNLPDNSNNHGKSGPGH